MSITLGLMLRVDGFPPSVPVPPLHQQGERPVPPIIEAERVVEVTPTARNNIVRNNVQINHHGNAFVHQQQPLTYSGKGASAGTLPPLNGQLLNLYA